MKRYPVKIEKINSSIFQMTKVASSIIGKAAEKFSFLPMGYQFQPRFRLMGIKGVKVRLVQPDGTFPSGLFSDIVTFLSEDLGKEVVMSTDVMEHFLPLNDFFEGGISDDIFSNFSFAGDDSPIILRDYQLAAVEAAFENRNCLLNLSTGAGKCLGSETKLKIRIAPELVHKYRHLLEE